MNWTGRPLHSQVIAITGASSGIGLCTALLAAERGSRIVGIARSERTLHDMVDNIRRRGGTASCFVADVADGAALQEAAEHAISRFGRIDSWINCAGVAIYGGIENVVRLDYRRLFDTNFWGVMNGTLAAMPHLRAQGGAIVNLGCDMSAVDLHTQAMYAITKNAVRQFTRAFREELRGEGNRTISISLIEPVAVDTPFLQHARNYLDTRRAPIGQTLHPLRVAEAILHATVRGGDDLRIGALYPAGIGEQDRRKLLPRTLDDLMPSDATLSAATGESLGSLGALHRPSRSGRIRSRLRDRHGEN